MTDQQSKVAQQNRRTWSLVGGLVAAVAVFSIVFSVGGGGRFDADTAYEQCRRTIEAEGGDASVLAPEDVGVTVKLERSVEGREYEFDVKGVGCRVVKRPGGDVTVSTIPLAP
jgi:hypothetical protein